MSGYSLVKAAYPNKTMSEHVYEERGSGVLVNLVGMRGVITSCKFEM